MDSRSCSRRDFLQTLGFGAAAMAVPGCLGARTVAKKKPNVIIIFADDLGFGDLGCFGHPTIRTPHLDRMAAEGAKMTQFYAAASVCTPSRAALLTGRLPIRTGMCSDKHSVLFPHSAGGLPPSEITIARMVKEQGYATGCIGKWHLGHLPKFLPTSHGFDSYFGIPYSNDMDYVKDVPREKIRHRYERHNVPLMRDEEIVERPAKQTTLTKRYGEEAVRFIQKNKGKPFFLYMAHTFPHIPLFASEKFLGTSARGLYGDTVEEIDYTVGQVLNTLEQQGLAENTLVLFTSDNGPWLTFKHNGGSSGLLRDGKGSTWEGGMREPTVAWWPGTIQPARIITDITSTLDLFPTIAELAGATVPSDRTYDGYSMVDLLSGKGKSKRNSMYFYRGTQLRAIRKGPWKMHLFTHTEYVGQKVKKHDPPLLFNLDHDPSEKYEIGKKHPNVIKDLQAEIAKHQATLKPVSSQLETFLEKKDMGKHIDDPIENQ